MKHQIVLNLNLSFLIKQIDILKILMGVYI